MKKTTLSAVSLNITDGKHGDCVNEENSGFYFVSCKDVKDGSINYESARQITEKDFLEANKRTLLAPNDILITNSGTIGRMAFIRDIPITYKTTFQKSVAIVKPNPDIIYPLYLYYQLQYCVERFINQSNGSAQKNLLLSTMREFELFLHDDLKIQRRIADILSAYDDLIENNRKQIKLLEEAAQRLYKEWFVDLRFPGHEHTKIVDGVPEGWEKSTVSDISSILRRGISPKYNDQADLMVINQKCIRQTIVTFDEARKQEKTFPEEMSLQDGDTVICSTGAGTLGRVGQVFGNHPKTTFDSHVTLVRAKPDFGIQYLFHFLKSSEIYLMGMGKGSTNQLELSRGTIQDLGILIPTKEIKTEFEMLVQTIHDKIGVANAEIAHLQNARDRLLPKLMSGEIEV